MRIYNYSIGQFQLSHRADKSVKFSLGQRWIELWNGILTFRMDYDYDLKFLSPFFLPKNLTYLLNFFPLGKTQNDLIGLLGFFFRIDFQVNHINNTACLQGKNIQGKVSSMPLSIHSDFAIYWYRISNYSLSKFSGLYFSAKIAFGERIKNPF